MTPTSTWPYYFFFFILDRMSFFFFNFGPVSLSLDVSIKNWECIIALEEALYHYWKWVLKLGEKKTNYFYLQEKMSKWSIVGQWEVPQENVLVLALLDSSHKTFLFSLPLPPPPPPPPPPPLPPPPPPPQKSVHVVLKEKEKKLENRHENSTTPPFSRGHELGVSELGGIIFRMLDGPSNIHEENCSCWSRQEGMPDQRTAHK